jgi:hypothetical protein
LIAIKRAALSRGARPGKEPIRAAMSAQRPIVRKENVGGRHRALDAVKRASQRGLRRGSEANRSLGAIADD